MQNKLIIVFFFLFFITEKTYSQSLDSLQLNGFWHRIYPTEAKVSPRDVILNKLKLTVPEHDLLIEWKLKKDSRLFADPKAIKKALQNELVRSLIVSASYFSKENHRNKFDRVNSDYKKADYKVCYLNSEVPLENVATQLLPDGKYIQKYGSTLDYNHFSKANVIKQSIACFFELKNNLLHGDVVLLSYSGDTIYKGKFIDGIKEGEHELVQKFYYNDNKQLRFTEKRTISSFTNGIRNGKFLYTNEKNDTTLLATFQNDFPTGEVMNEFGNYFNKHIEIYDAFDFNLEQINDSTNLDWISLLYFENAFYNIKNSRISSDFFRVRYLDKFTFTKENTKDFLFDKRVLIQLSNEIRERNFPKFQNNYKIYSEENILLLDVNWKLIKNEIVFFGDVFYENGKLRRHIYIQADTLCKETYSLKGELIIELEDEEIIESNKKMIDGFLATKLRRNRYVWEGEIKSNFGDTVFIYKDWEKHNLTYQKYLLLKDSVYIEERYTDNFVFRKLHSSKIDFYTNQLESKELIINYLPFLENNSDFSFTDKLGKPITETLIFSKKKSNENLPITVFLKQFPLLPESMNANLEGLENLTLKIKDGKIADSIIFDFGREKRISVLKVNNSLYSGTLNIYNFQKDIEEVTYKRHFKKYDNRHFYLKKKIFKGKFLEKSISIKNNQLDGLYEIYSVWGQKLTNVEFKNGAPEGDFFSFGEDAQKVQRISGSYQNGLKQGDFIFNDISTKGKKIYNYHEKPTVYEFKNDTLIRSEEHNYLFYYSSVAGSEDDYYGKLFPDNSYRMINSQLYSDEKDSVICYANGDYEIKKIENELVVESRFYKDSIPWFTNFNFLFLKRIPIVYHKEFRAYNHYFYLSYFDKEGRNKSLIYSKFYPNGNINYKGKRYGNLKWNTWQFYNYYGIKTLEVDYSVLNESIINPYYRVHQNDLFKNQEFAINFPLRMYNQQGISASGIVKEEHEFYNCGADNYFISREIEILKDESSNDSIDFMNGKQVYYFENGMKMSEGANQNGLPVGLWKFYSPDGKLFKIGNYILGKKDGRWLEGDLDAVAYIEDVCLDKDSEEIAYKIASLQRDKNIIVSVFKNGTKF